MWERLVHESKFGQMLFPKKKSVSLFFSSELIPASVFLLFSVVLCLYVIFNCSLLVTFYISRLL